MWEHLGNSRGPCLTAGAPEISLQVASGASEARPGARSALAPVAARADPSSIGRRQVSAILFWMPTPVDRQVLAITQHDRCLDAIAGSAALATLGALGRQNQLGSPFLSLGSHWHPPLKHVARMPIPVKGQAWASTPSQRGHSWACEEVTGHTSPQVPSP